MAFYPGINIASHILESGGPTVIPIGIVAIDEFLKRAGAGLDDEIISGAAVTTTMVDIGTPDTVGAWRLDRDGTDLVFERCDSIGPVVYNEKYRVVL